MDAAFLKASVGPALKTALLHTALLRPDDPIEHIAALLAKEQKNIDDEKQAIIDTAAMEEQMKSEAERQSREAALKAEEEREIMRRRDEDNRRRMRALQQRNIQLCQQYALMMAKKRHDRDGRIANDGVDISHTWYLGECLKNFKKLNLGAIKSGIATDVKLGAFVKSALLLLNYDPEFSNNVDNLEKTISDQLFKPAILKMNKSQLKNEERNLRRMAAARNEMGAIENIYKHDLTVAILDEYMRALIDRHNTNEDNKDKQIEMSSTADCSDTFGFEPEGESHDFEGILPVLNRKTLELGGDGSYSINLGWEMNGDATVDLDGAVIVYDKIGSVVDTVYFNKLESKDGCLKHQGDEADSSSGEERLVFTPSKCGEDVRSICLILNCNKENQTFKDVKSASFSITQGETILAKHSSECMFDQTGLLMAILNKSDSSTWTISLVGEPAKDDEDDGTNFMDCHPACLKYMEYMGMVPISSRMMRKCANPYAMDKNESFDVPACATKVHMGLGWNVVNGAKFDVDCSVVLFGENNEVKDFVNFDKLASNDKAFVHTGDNLTGEVEGDDESIKLDYSMIDNAIETAVFVVTIYQQGTFDDVDGTFIRMVDEVSGKELCRYSVPTEAGGFNGLILSKIIRIHNDDGPDTWKMVTVGKPGHGSTYEELLPDITELLTNSE